MLQPTSPENVLDRVTLVAPLGVRFWDGVTGGLVSDGLVVVAFPADDLTRRVPAVLNTTGAYVFPHLPGLRTLERGAGDAAYWATLPGPRPFTVEVVDGRGRFLPFRFQAAAPTRGLFAWECGPLASPATPAARWVPLFSAPSRQVPAAMAVVRAELWDVAAGGPASWATLEARIAGRLVARGVADAAGRVALIFAYPELADSPLGSPGARGGTPLAQQTWAVELAAAYAPASPVPAIPDLCATLTAPPATLWADSARSAPLAAATLAVGQELVARSRDAATGAPLATLLLSPSPAGSPPTTTPNP